MIKLELEKFISSLRYEFENTYSTENNIPKPLNSKELHFKLERLISYVNEKTILDILANYLKGELNWVERDNPDNITSSELRTVYTIDVKEGFLGELTSRYMIKLSTFWKDNLQIYRLTNDVYKPKSERLFVGNIKTRIELLTLLTQLGIHEEKETLGW